MKSEFFKKRKRKAIDFTGCKARLPRNFLIMSSSELKSRLTCKKMSTSVYHFPMETTRYKFKFENLSALKSNGFDKC